MPYLAFITLALGGIPSTSSRAIISKRQIGAAAAATTDSASDSNSSGGGGGGTSITVIVPIVVVLGVLVLVLVLWMTRNKIFLRLRHRMNTTSTSDNASQSGLTAEELAATSPNTRRQARARARTARLATANAAAAAGGGTANTTDHANDSQTGARGRRRRSRRYVRRTESGRSIRTLPEYSKEAGDEELVLVRQRSSSASSIEEEDYTEDEMDHDLEAEPEQESGPGQDREGQAADNSIPRRRSPASTPLPLSPTSPTSDARHEDDEHEQEVTLDDNSRHDGPQSAPLGAPRRSLTQISRRGWGEAPTYLEAMSSPSFEDMNASPTPDGDLEAGVPPPRTRNTSLRDRTSSSFRDLLSRAGMTFGANPSSFRLGGHGRPDMVERRTGGASGSRHSSTSLLLHPSSSRMSTLTSATRDTRDTNTASLYPSPWASTHSLLHISSPVPNTAVRASFDTTHIPKAGLSDDQMRFLSSSDAVNLVGVKLDAPPGAAKRRRRSTATTMLGDSPRIGSGENDDLEGDDYPTGGAPPPSWEELDGQRRRDEAEQRLGLARPTTRGSSDSGENGDEDNPAGSSATPAAGPQQTSSISPQTPHTSLMVKTRAEGQAAQAATAQSQHSANSSVDAPSVEIEPPTPISAQMVYPPTSASAVGSARG